MDANLLNMVLSLLTNTNPQQILNSNPQFQAILNQARQSGSVKDYVLQYAKQNGLDLAPFFEFAKQRGLKF